MIEKKTLTTVKTIEKTVENHVFCDSHGGTHADLYDAIKADLNIPPLKKREGKYSAYERPWENTINEYFNAHENVYHTFKGRTHLSEFHWDERKRYAFLVSSEEELEMAIVLLGFFCDLDCAWSDASSRVGGNHCESYIKKNLYSFWEDVRHALKDKDSVVAYCFYCDDSGDNYHVGWAPLQEVVDEIEQDLKDRKKQLEAVQKLTREERLLNFSAQEAKDGHSWATSSFRWERSMDADTVQEKFWEAVEPFRGALKGTIHWTSLRPWEEDGKIKPEWVELKYRRGRTVLDGEVDAMNCGCYYPGDTMYVGYRNGHLCIERWREEEGREIVVEQYSPYQEAGYN